MTNILGTLKDAEGTALNARLLVDLDDRILDDSTTPDTLYSTKQVVFEIASGAIDIDLQESETNRITYRFRLYLYEDVDTVEAEPRMDFRAVVPNVASVQFNSLIPTGISRDTLDTGAIRVAKLITTDPDLVSLVKIPRAVNVPVDGITTTTTVHIPKPFSGQVRIKNLDIFATSGFTDWTYAVGITNSSGNEELLTVSSSTSNTVGGKLQRQQVYEITRASSILALFVRFTPGVGSTALTGSALLTFTDI